MSVGVQVVRETTMSSKVIAGNVWTNFGISLMK